MSDNYINELNEEGYNLSHTMFSFFADVSINMKFALY